MKSAHMLPVEVEQLGTGGMVLGKGVEHFAERQDRPAVGASPVECGMFVHRLDPAVAEELLLGNPHLLLEEPDLLHGLVEISAVAGHLAVPRHGRNAHEHVVEPYGVRKGPVPRERAVVKAVFIFDHFHIMVYDGSQAQFGVNHHVPYHRHADRARVVKHFRSHDLSHLAVDLSAGFGYFKLWRLTV